jgi:hypothetical protein
VARSQGSRVTGHVQERQLKRGPTFYLKTRVPGRVPEQTTVVLGPEHVGKGRCPEGCYTRRMAEEALQAFLTDARRGLHDTAEQPETVTFRQAADEFLRYVAIDKGAERSTVYDYRSVIRGYLLEEFGADTPLADIRASRSTRTRPGSKPRRSCRTAPSPGTSSSSTAFTCAPWRSRNGASHATPPELTPCAGLPSSTAASSRR